MILCVFLCKRLLLILFNRLQSTGSMKEALYKMTCCTSIFMTRLYCTHSMIYIITNPVIFNIVIEICYISCYLCCHLGYISLSTKKKTANVNEAFLYPNK